MEKMKKFIDTGIDKMSDSQILQAMKDGTKTIKKERKKKIIYTTSKRHLNDINPTVIIKVTDKETGKTYTNIAKDDAQIHALHFNNTGEIFCVELLNGHWITKNFTIEFENYFASTHMDCAKYLTDDEFERLQGLHKKVALKEKLETKEEMKKAIDKADIEFLKRKEKNAGSK